MLKQFCGWVRSVDNSRLVSGQMVRLYTAAGQRIINHAQARSFRHYLVTAFTTAFPPHFLKKHTRYFNSYTLNPQDL
jgi:hypothetical protein